MYTENLKQAKWALPGQGNELESFSGEQPIKMKHSDGTARPLVVDDSAINKFGADIVRFEAGKGVGLHTHVGAHILLVTKGTGILTYGCKHGLDGPAEEQHEMFPGMIYLIPSNMPHAIKAITELVLVAVGNDHKPADSEERLDVVS